MVEDRIGYRYAKSAYALAAERGEVAAVLADLAMIQETADQSPEFRNFLSSPVVSPAKKAGIMNTLFAARYTSQMTGDLVQMLVAKHREAYLLQMIAAFRHLYDEAHRIRRGVLTSASPLPAGVQASITRALEAKTGDTYEIETRVDPALIGGFSLQLGDMLFDGSIAASLRKLKRSFSNASVIR
ncbi:MAG: ATP synthase F1 subunit delta [Bacteroidia bacterium]|nr:ATP synthase F1 subunit delta [Bacteroidia bacterium]